MERLHTSKNRFPAQKSLGVGSVARPGSLALDPCPLDQCTGPGFACVLACLHSWMATGGGVARQRAGCVADALAPTLGRDERQRAGRAGET